MTDDDTGSTSFAKNITVNDVAPGGIGTSITGTTFLEGTPETLTVTFSDVGTLDTFTATVNWADGTPTQSVAIGTAGAPNHSFTVSHLFVDDNPTGTPSDATTVSITVQDDDTLFATAGVAVTVSNVAPVVTGSNVSASSIAEGQTLGLTLTVSDPGVLEHRTR